MSLKVKRLKVKRFTKLLNILSIDIKNKIFLSFSGLRTMDRIMHNARIDGMPTTCD